ncbi:MAG TPA: CdaR family protein [Candidatus Baltobacteraceae bacterium]
MVSAIRNNFGIKLLSLFLAIVGWAYFRFASNPLITARFDQQISVPITAVNVPSGYIARFPDKAAAVTIVPERGQPPVKPDEVKAVLDLSNRTAGVYNVPVQLVAPNVAVQSLSPASVTLTIEKIDQKAFPVAMYYGTQGNVVVSRFTVTPSSVTVRGPDSELSQVATVRINMPLNTSGASFDEMIRPVAVNSNGDQIGDVQVTPNLVRVQAKLLPASGSPK